jgi:hypothetical protein
MAIDSLSVCGCEDSCGAIRFDYHCHFSSCLKAVTLTIRNGIAWCLMSESGSDDAKGVPGLCHALHAWNRVAAVLPDGQVNVDDTASAIVRSPTQQRSDDGSLHHHRTCNQGLSLILRVHAEIVQIRSPEEASQERTCLPKPKPPASWTSRVAL